MSGEQKLQSSSAHSFLQPPVNSSLLGPNIPLSTLFPNTFNLFSSLILESKFHINTKSGKTLFDIFQSLRFRWPNGIYKKIM
jgi:hypothetical protein